MKVLILTQDSYQHCYVANQLSRHISITRIIVERSIAISRPRRVVHLLRKYGIRGGIDRAVGVSIERIMGYRKEARREMMRVFGQDNCRDFDNADLVTYVHGINSYASENLIKEIAPDVIAVYGTSIVSDRILGLAGFMAFNLHTGISPYYRGAGCAFWPVYNGELDYLGATVHECTARLDGGTIFGVARAKLQEDDVLETLFPRCVVTGTSLYVQVLKRWLDEPGGIQGQEQNTSVGKEYRASMMNWRKKRIARKLIRKGIIREYAKRQMEMESETD